jgi:hypothetical protein
VSETFAQKVWLIVLDKLAIGLLVLIAAFILNRFLERFRSEQSLRKEFESLKDQTALKHLQRQIEELYSPLLGLIQYSHLVYEVAKRKIPSLRGDRRNITEEEVGVWRYFAETYFLPLNRQIAELIRAKIYLIASDEMPSSFLRFFEHQAQFACLYKLWKDLSVESHDIPGIGWPASFENDVKRTLIILRGEHNEYVRRIKRTN